MRRAVATFTAVVILGVAGVVHHSRAQTTTTIRAVPDAPVQRTSAAGTLSSLEGRWLALTTLGTGGAHRSSASLWDVERTGDGLVLSERHVILPEAQRRMVEQAGWTPTAADVALLASGSDTLPTETRGLARVHHELFGRDGFTDELRREPISAGALWVVRQTYSFAPERSRPVKQVRLLAADAEEPTGHRGRYLDVTIAAAPLPIPIKLPGTFRLVRLTAPSRSIWARIADAFRGCN